MDKPKIIYLKALFKKHKPENKLEKIIKDFVVHADLQEGNKEKLKVPPKVSIAEGVEIAKIFSTKDSSSFVNGILDAIYNDEYIKRITKA